MNLEAAAAIFTSVRPRLFRTPLWFYILKESEHRGGDDRPGPVGARIVAEVLIGL